MLVGWRTVEVLRIRRGDERENKNAMLHGGRPIRLGKKKTPSDASLTLQICYASLTRFL
jgi:hypothetical protein